MAITVKKKMMTVKTVKAKPRPSDGEDKPGLEEFQKPVSEAPTAAPSESTQPAPSVPAAPSRSPVKRSANLFSVILALIAAALFAMLIVLQWLELAEYNKPPSLWPQITMKPIPDAPEFQE